MSASGARWAGKATRELPASWPEHSPERRQFSVLCWRGWCDSGFRDRDIAMLLTWVTVRPSPVPARLPIQHCHMPFTCECECHDRIKAAMGGTEVTAHAAATYSRSQGFSLDHAVLNEPLTAGRSTRKAGEVLCKATLVPWGHSPRGNGTVQCLPCLARAERYGVMLP